MQGWMGWIRRLGRETGTRSAEPRSVVKWTKKACERLKRASSRFVGYFTPACVMPSMKSFCKIAKKIVTGSTISVAAAMSAPKFVPVSGSAN